MGESKAQKAKRLEKEAADKVKADDEELAKMQAEEDAKKADEDDAPISETEEAANARLEEEAEEDAKNKDDNRTAPKETSVVEAEKAAGLEENIEDLKDLIVEEMCLVTTGKRVDIQKAMAFCRKLMDLEKKK